MSGSAERGHKDADSAEHDNDAERLDQSHDYADQARRRHERAQHVVRRHEDEGSIERGLAESEVRSIPVEEPPETIEEEYEEGYEEESPSAPPLRPPPALLFMGPVVISLVLFSMAGVLIRVHLTRLFTYLGEPIYGLIWAQMLGCFIMGIATRTKGVLLRYSPALNLGITTGLCGSITTFSSWQLLVYEQFFNTERHDHSHFRNFLGGMSVLASTLGCSMAALRLGQIIGDELRLLYGIYLLHTKSEDDPMYRVSTALLGPGKPTSPRRGWMGWDEWRTMDMILAVSGILAIVAACIVVALARGTRSVSIALLFGPVGTLLRWRLSSLNLQQHRIERMLPARLKGLPIGTFLANVLGSMVLAIIHILQKGVVVWPSTAGCYVLAAMADGFCGCLTTVSTFAAEVSVLTARRSILYATASIVVTQSCFLLIAGIYFKTSTVDYGVC